MAIGAREPTSSRGASMVVRRFVMLVVFVVILVGGGAAMLEDFFMGIAVRRQGRGTGFRTVLEATGRLEHEGASQQRLT